MKNILKFNELEAKLKIAKAQEEQAKLQFKQTLLDAGREVSNALAVYDAEVKKGTTELFNYVLESCKYQKEYNNYVVEYNIYQLNFIHYLMQIELNIFENELKTYEYIKK